MGEIRPPPSALLFFGLILSEGVEPEVVHERLRGEFGEILTVSEVWPFTQTDYYGEEMGPNLQRQFVAMATPFDPGELARVKRRANEIEAELAGPQGRRRVNIDPGYVTQAKVVLSSTKDHAHRVYLGQGIHGEVTLTYHRGRGYEPMPWTYPDYREERVREWFNRVRGSLKA
jgi:hypothetical protein